MGVMLLVFTPVPYVDATASTAFSDKYRRMVVAGAGIMVELLLAAVAMWAWAGLAPGLARDAAFDVMLIGAGSTLLFNGNPLLRFDGYHVLADAVEIPNLGIRSNRYLLYLGQRWLLGLRDVRSPVTTPGERPWLIVYGIASAIYYPLPLHLQECFADLNYPEGTFPESERAAKETIALPIYAELTDEQLASVVEGFKQYFGAA